MRLTRALQHLIVVLISFTFIDSCKYQGDNEKENVLFIIVDDLNDMVGALDSQVDVTPNLDRLSRQSTLFTSAYCTAPACGPSRASLLSGKLPSTTGIYGKIFHEHNNSYMASLCAPGYFSEHRGFWANLPDTSLITLTDFRFEGGSKFAWAAVPDGWEN